MMTRRGIKFDATVPNEAEIIGNKNSVLYFDQSTGDFVVLALKLLNSKHHHGKEHFNENYMGIFSSISQAI